MRGGVGRGLYLLERGFFVVDIRGDKIGFGLLEFIVDTPASLLSSQHASESLRTDQRKIKRTKGVAQFRRFARTR